MTTATIGELTLAASIDDADLIEIQVAASGLSRRVTRQTLVGATLTGLGTIATNAKTLTINDTGIAALLNVAQTFTSLKTFTAGINLGDTTLSVFKGQDWGSTIAIQGSTGNPTVTYTERYGYYLRVGPVTFFSWEINVATISGGSGELRVNLPIAASAFGRQPRWPVYLAGVDMPAGAVDNWFGIAASNSFGTINSTADDTTATALQVSSVANGDRFACSGFYYV